MHDMSDKKPVLTLKEAKKILAEQRAKATARVNKFRKSRITVTVTVAQESHAALLRALAVALRTGNAGAISDLVVGHVLPEVFVAIGTAALEPTERPKRRRTPTSDHDEFLNSLVKVDRKAELAEFNEQEARERLKHIAYEAVTRKAEEIQQHEFRQRADLKLATELMFAPDEYLKLQPVKIQNLVTQLILKKLSGDNA